MTELIKTPAVLLLMLATVSLSGCGTSRPLLKEVEVVEVEIQAPQYHPPRPQTITAPPNDADDFFDVVTVKLVGASFLAKIAEAYPDDPEYFDDEDLALLLDAAVAWMGEEVKPAYYCIGDQERHNLESWMERVKRYAATAESNFDYYERNLE